MQGSEPLLNLYKQNNKLAIRLISPGFGRLPFENIEMYGLTHRKSYYFFLFMIDGLSQHGVDLREFEITNNELLFILPHQIHKLPTENQGRKYFKIGFDEDCLSLLPKYYPFLIDPYNNQKIGFSQSAATRVKSIFVSLRGLLSTPDTDYELILAHLNSLLAEINATYFSTDKNPANDKLSKYLSFKLFVENNFTAHIAVTDIAEKLALNPNALYKIVRHYSGYSPKEFITNRLILEAKRRLYYSESPSIKELAYSLGFNDPEYFSRLFKKVTGTAIGTFVQDLSGH